MHIAYVSSYPPSNCGIATYSKRLLEYVHNECDISVLSIGPSNHNDVVSSHSPTEIGLGQKLFECIDSLRPELVHVQHEFVHVQHEFGLFGALEGIAIVDLVNRLCATNIKTVVSFHTLFSHLNSQQRFIVRQIATNANALIVHGDVQKTNLLNFAPNVNEGKIKVIPHGVRSYQERSNKKLTERYILLPGYVRATKNYGLVIDILPEIIDRVGKINLIIAGDVRRYDEEAEVKNQLLDKINNSPVRQLINFTQKTSSQEEFDDYILNASLVVLPYTEISQSGIFADCLSFLTPVVTSNLDEFVQVVGDSGAGLTANSNSDFVNAITTLLEDQELLTNCREKMKRYNDTQGAWKLVSKHHLKLYKKIYEDS